MVSPLRVPETKSLCGVRINPRKSTPEKERGSNLVQLLQRRGRIIHSLLRSFALM